MEQMSAGHKAERSMARRKMNDHLEELDEEEYVQKGDWRVHHNGGRTLVKTGGYRYRPHKHKVIVRKM